MIGSPSRSARPLRCPTSAVSVSVQVEALAAQHPGRQQSLVDVAELAAEAHERAGADHPGDLALEAALPARLEQLAPEQEGRADAVGVALDRRRLALALGAAPAGIAHRSGVAAASSPAPIADSSAR